MSNGETLNGNIVQHVNQDGSYSYTFLPINISWRQFDIKTIRIMESFDFYSTDERERINIAFLLFQLDKEYEDSNKFNGLEPYHKVVKGVENLLEALDDLPRQFVGLTGKDYTKAANWLNSLKDAANVTLRGDQRTRKGRPNKKCEERLLSNVAYIFEDYMGLIKSARTARALLECEGINVPSDNTRRRIRDFRKNYPHLSDGSKPFQLPMRETKGGKK